MVNEEAVLIPGQPVTESSYVLVQNIAAIELRASEREGARLGAVMQLPVGTRVQICGQGFNERTAKVRANEKFYFVFLQDLGAAVPDEARQSRGQAEFAPRARYQVA